MPSNAEYVCSNCGESPGRDHLVVKRVVFMEMGVGAKTLRSRVVGWLCTVCLEKDSEYNREAFDTPGTTNWHKKEEINGKQRLSARSAKTHEYRPLQAIAEQNSLG